MGILILLLLFFGFIVSLYIAILEEKHRRRE